MKILCVGQNYAKHAAEMGSVTAADPIWFWKPESAIIGDGDTIRLPAGIGAVHHEVEMAVRIGPDGQPDAMTVALDMTARDLQTAAKKAGRPWAQAKGYDTFLPLGDWVTYEPGPHQLQLLVDGEMRQNGTTEDMTWDVPALLAHAKTWTTLEMGDILLTGTPDGVGPVAAGNELVVHLVGHAKLHVRAEIS
jgi:2-keto-4-pentenoate hydratase/2-oxohepta-3-ene-1,7-dioic acid hydratase in catechol pathway